MKLVITFWMPCARAFCSDSLLSCSSSATRAGLDVRKRLIELTTMTSEQLRSLAARVYPVAAAAKKGKTAKASPQASKITKHFQREKGP